MNIFETTKYCLTESGPVSGAEYVARCMPNALIMGGLLGILIVGGIFLWAYITTR